MSPWALDSYLAGNCRAVDPGSLSVAGVLLASGHLQREGEIVLSDGKHDYSEYLSGLGKSSSFEELSSF